MIKSHEEANRYYDLVNQYIDDYVERHKILPSRLGNYFKNNERLLNFLSRKGLGDIKNINRVVEDIIEDRIALEKDGIIKFESFISESVEYKDIKSSIFIGIERANINHEKILADYFSVSLSQIDILSSNKHIFSVEDSKTSKVYIFTSEELDIIKENIKYFLIENLENDSVGLYIIGEKIPIKSIVDSKKLEEHLDSIIDEDKLFSITKKTLNCFKFTQYKDSLILFL